MGRERTTAMSERFTPDKIREFWTDMALEHGQSPSASWSDRMVIEMEIREIIMQIEDGDRVLDVGCANGYSTVKYALHKNIFIRGLDYIPEMIGQARRRLEEIKDSLKSDVEFETGDITRLEEVDESYDKLIVTRVIINLGDWESQKRGLRECMRVLKPGGVLLLSEATVQGWRKMNGFRREWGLPEIKMPQFNLYVDEEKVIEELSPIAQTVEIINFSSTYYVGTRVLKPLLIKALGADIDAADPDMEWNRWFAQAPSFGDYGTQKLFVLRKKSRE
jgi:ubiquinone/menaquinone biosynthesis C-methylase UbiE